MAAMEDNTSRNDSVSLSSDNKLSCDLTGKTSFILQFALGCVAFSTLILKRFREQKSTRRSVFIWIADTLKQAIAMLGVHFVNLFLSALLPLPDTDRCILYLMNFLLDSTFGLLIIYVTLKIINWVVTKYDITPLKTGEYGQPFKFHYWLAQCMIVLFVMLIMKLVIGPLMIFNFWGKVGSIILPIHNKEIRTAIVIFIVPFIVNVLMFWIVDSIIMRKTLSKDSPSSSGVSYKKSQRNIYVPLTDAPPPEDDEQLVTDSDTVSLSHNT